MSAIKLHLEQAEYDAIVRCARTIGVNPEDVVYAGLNRLMLTRNTPDVAGDIIETRSWRKHNLPMWSDSACSVHAYEGKPDDEPAPAEK